MRLLAVALLGHPSMAGDASAAVAALAHDLVVLALRALLGAAMTASAAANSTCTCCNASNLACTSTLSDIVSTAFQHATSTVCHSGIDSAGVARASLTLVALARLAPLLGANVSCPKTLVIYAASILSADRETLSGGQVRCIPRHCLDWFRGKGATVCSHLHRCLHQ